ncbi:YqhR family membrane protein [Paenibacillus sp. D2_2]|uniref:YqhR family membrane protein n=1 Tax=Paenibacillus sp. D2_2 TaxID=3073092 RepID=UPI002814A6EC|nr:YqhR family membrane protein [Paenibacillus sp. D2_2]WMT42605.1 YqhR family membrane protein [Paenibacillus sp. D2_2]
MDVYIGGWIFRRIAMGRNQRNFLFYALNDGRARIYGGALFQEPVLEESAGYYAGWGFFILFSLLATLVYILLFRKLRGPLPGILYGIVWWVILFVWAGPSLHLMEPLRKLSMNTIISEFCLYLLWGMFIGYSVAHEYTDERKREPEEMSDKTGKNSMKRPTENPQH